MPSLFVIRVAVSDIKKRGRQIEVNHFNQSPKDFLAILPGNQMPLILCRGFSYFLVNSPHSNQYPLIIFQGFNFFSDYSTASRICSSCYWNSLKQRVLITFDDEVFRRCIINVFNKTKNISSCFTVNAYLCLLTYTYCTLTLYSTYNYQQF